MKPKLIIHIDENHPILIEGLKKLGYKNDKYYNSDLKTILDKIKDYNGLVIRSRFKIDKTGNVVDIQGRSTHPKLTKEGERMAGLIPKMKPGQQSNKPVEVIFDLPIVFNVKD